MVRKICKGIKTGTVYIEDEEASIHRYLNKEYASSGSKLKRILPEPMEIKKVELNEKDDQ